jgi:hypothetical protein
MLARRLLGYDPEYHAAQSRASAFWPVDPRTYDFFSVDPMWVMLQTYSHHKEMVVYETRYIDPYSLRLAGDSCLGSSDARLSLLERFGYVEKKFRMCHMSRDEVARELFEIFSGRKLDLPLYEYSCLRDVPIEFLFV